MNAWSYEKLRKMSQRLNEVRRALGDVQEEQAVERSEIQGRFDGVEKLFQLIGAKIDLLIHVLDVESKLPEQIQRLRESEEKLKAAILAAKPK